MSASDNAADLDREIVVRQMTIDDLSAVYHMGEKLFTPKEFPNLYRTWDEYEVLGLFQADPDFCLIADADDEIAGFALGTTIVKRRTAWNYGHLVWLGVDTPFQRYGVAGQLLDKFRDIMQEAGVRILLVDTQADNIPAIRFFRKKGFANPTDHVYMTLNLEADG